MANSFHDLFGIAERYSSFSQTEDRAWTMETCAICGGSQMAVLAFSADGATRWLRCVTCSSGHVSNDGVISPSIKPLTIPEGVTGVELAAWMEVRECLGVGAYTAAVMMCRKLLFHIAVAKGLPEKDSNNWAPSFVEAVQHLEDTGLITKIMRPWVDRIKDVGNEANHEITPVTMEIATDVAKFTEQLLRLTYEMPSLVSRQMTGIDVKDGESTST